MYVKCPDKNVALNTLILSNIEAPAARLLKRNLIVATFRIPMLFKQLSCLRQYLPAMLH